jgi:hypothetical protein
MNGFGSTYYTCATTSGNPGTPNGSNCQPGTAGGTNYTQQMADDAAAQYSGQAGLVYDNLTCGTGPNTVTVVCKTTDPGLSTGRCTCWAYTGTGNQIYAIGHAYQSSGTGVDKGCFCPTCLGSPWN